MTNGNWTPGGVASDWAWGTPSKPVISGAASGAKCWIVGGLTGSSYNNGERSYLTSPCFDLSGLTTPEIEFKVFWETEKRFDGAALQYSTNNGASWTYLGTAGSDNNCTTLNWFNEPAVNFLSGNPGWSGNRQPTMGSCQGGNGSSNWVLALHGLEPVAGEANVIFRFEFGAGTTCNNFDGFAIDDIVIRERAPSTVDYSFVCRPGFVVDFQSIVNCPISLEWNFDDPASGPNNISIGNAPSHTFSGPGSYDVSLTATYAGGIVLTETKTITQLAVSIAQTQFIQCNGDMTAALTATASGSSSGYGYVWNTTPPQNTPTIQNIGAGTVDLIVSSGNACRATASFTIMQPTVISAIKNVTQPICPNANGSISVIVSGGVAPYQYLWSNGATTSSVQNLTPNTYTVTITDANSCTKSETTQLVCYTAPPPPPPVPPVIPITAVYFPTSFTPNGDGLNDLFGPAGNNFTGVSNYTLTIYNRYGEIVFRNNDPYKKWDGRLKGKNGSHESFVYIATYLLNNKQVSAKGTVLRIK